MNGPKAYMLSIMKDERKSIDASIVRVLLSTVSVVYLFLLRCVYFFYKTKILRAREVPARVISIGNITLGGTGKTPFAVKLARDIEAMGRKPAVLNRGYGGDESYLLEEKLKGIPVLTGRDRIRNAERASLELGSDCIILDDGFQHYGIKRDINIVLIDSTSSFGNMKLFPRGILREPLTRLKDADIAILTKSDMGDSNLGDIRNLLEGINNKIEIAESFYLPLDLKDIFSGRIVPLAYISDKRLATLAGIANPDYFNWMVRRLGGEISGRFSYPDHHPYSDSDISYVVKECLSKGIKTLITTEKDAVRLKRLKDISRDIEVLAMRIDFRIISNEEAIFGRLRSVFSS